MTEFLVMLGVIYTMHVIVGIIAMIVIYRREVLVALKWLWDSVLFLGAVVALSYVLFAIGLLVVAFMVMSLLFVPLLGLTVAAASTLLIGWAIGLIVWAVTRKRDSFDTVNSGVMRGWHIIGVVYEKYGQVFDELMELFFSMLAAGNGLYTFTVAKGEVFIRPFVWLSRKLWPRD